MRASGVLGGCGVVGWRTGDAAFSFQLGGFWAAFCAVLGLRRKKGEEKKGKGERAHLNEVFEICLELRLFETWGPKGPGRPARKSQRFLK
jgi:hypothetical protein